MKIGINLLNFGPGTTPESIRRWAEVVEGLGYHGIFISDHVAITPTVAVRYPEPFYDTLITLSFLAALTKRVDLGTTVIVLPYRHPVLLARHVANLDRLSGGRVIVGIGVGNAKDEFDVLGAHYSRRGAWSDDALRAVVALWTGHGEVSYAGKYVQLERVAAIATEQQPHPPIWVGGVSEAAVRRAIRFGLPWHPINQPIAVIRDRWLPFMREQSARLGQPVSRLVPRIKMNITEAPLPEIDRAPGAGSLEQIHADLKALEVMGADYVVLDWYTWGELEATKNHERAFAMMGTLAERVVDLQARRVR